MHLRVPQEMGNFQVRQANLCFWGRNLVQGFSYLFSYLLRKYGIFSPNFTNLCAIFATDLNISLVSHTVSYALCYTELLRSPKIHVKGNSTLIIIRRKQNYLAFDCLSSLRWILGSVNLSHRWWKYRLVECDAVYFGELIPVLCKSMVFASSG